MMGLELEWLTNILSNLYPVINVIAVVVNFIVENMLVILDPIGNFLRNFMLLVLENIPVGSYVWYIVVAAVIVVVAIVFVFLFPGEKEENT